jgi:hypothetical protein
MKHLFWIASLLLVMTSCTMVTSKNIPGKRKSEFPKEMVGVYDLQYPESMSSLMDGAVGTKIEIKAKQLEMINSEGTNAMVLNDSIFLTTIKKDVYLCLGVEPNVTIFKMVKKGNDYELYGMWTDGNASLEDLKPFFTTIEAKPLETDDPEGNSDVVIEVTVNEKKLGAYFKSKYPSKEPFKLIRAH